MYKNHFGVQNIRFLSRGMPACVFTRVQYKNEDRILLKCIEYTFVFITMFCSSLAVS